MNSVEFLGKKYDSLSLLAASMGKNWSEGRRYLFSGDLRKALKNAGEVKASGTCVNYEIHYREHPVDGDRHFLRWLICEGKLASLVYQGKNYGNLDKVTEDMANPTRDEKDLYFMMLQMQLWEAFAVNNGKAAEGTTRIRFVENRFRRVSTDEEKMYWLHVLPVVLKDNQTLDFDRKAINTVPELSQYLQTKADTSWSALQNAIHKLYLDDQHLTPVFTGWLINQGFQEQLQTWMDKYQNTDEEEAPDKVEKHVINTKAVLSSTAQVEERLTTLLQNQPEVVKSTDDLTANLQRALPDNPNAVELLIHAYSIGIVDAIDHADQLNKAFVDRFVMLLKKNFKDDEKLARWAVSAWCRCYGEGVKHYRFETE